MLVGLVGKTNVGKTTFFSAATLVEAERGNRPFVTINPNEGVGHVRVKSVCTEFGVRCNPKYGWCNGRYRFVPVKLLDVAGLVPEAHKGKGLGNKFLDDLRRASVSIVVVDASGATDDEGNPLPPGSHDPIRDVEIVKEEFAMWIFSIIKRGYSKIRGKILSGSSTEEALAEVLSGLEIRRADVERVIQELGLKDKKFLNWSDEDLLSFSKEIRRRSKPFVIAANKADVEEAEENIRRMRELLEEPVVPVSSEAELILRKAAKAGLIRYEPGDPDFDVIDESKLTRSQLKVLEMVREKVLKKYGSTGVQKSIETAVFDVLGMKVVFPVENETKLSDKEGNILPDAILLERNGTVLDLAEKIHSEIAKKALFGIDVRTGRRISLETVLNHRDVVKIVASR